MCSWVVNEVTKCTIKCRKGWMRMKMLDTCTSFPCSDTALDAEKVASPMHQQDTRCGIDLSFSASNVTDLEARFQSNPTYC